VSEQASTNDQILSEQQTFQVYLVEDSATLEQLAEKWGGLKVLAIDTEFERRTTYFAKLALVQIFDGRAIYLIDPLEVECPQTLRDVFVSENIVKILHSSKEDIEVLYTSWQCELNNLFDTQIAYHFQYGEVSIGYAKLVEDFTGVHVSKHQTQSDWIKRPLSSAQLKYAAMDVIYLIKIFERLRNELQENNLYSLFVKECQETSLSSRTRIDSFANYREAKDVWQLSEIDLGLFRQLFDWREQKAKVEDITRNHIIRDQEMVEIAKSKPDSINQLKEVSDIHPRSIRRYGVDWLQIVEHWQVGEKKALPKVLNPRDVEQLKALSSNLETVVKSAAKQLNIPVTLLMSKRIIRKLAYALITDTSMPLNWSGWRKSLLHDAVESKKQQIVNI